MALFDGQRRAQWPDGVADWIGGFGVLDVEVVRVGDVSVQRAGLLGGGAAARSSPHGRLLGLNGPVSVVDFMELDAVEEGRILDRSLVVVVIIVVIVVDEVVVMVAVVVVILGERFV